MREKMLEAFVREALLKGGFSSQTPMGEMVNHLASPMGLPSCFGSGRNLRVPRERKERTRTDKCFVAYALGRPCDHGPRCSDGKLCKRKARVNGRDFEVLVQQGKLEAERERLAKRLATGVPLVRFRGKANATEQVKKNAATKRPLLPEPEWPRQPQNPYCLWRATQEDGVGGNYAWKARRKTLESFT